MNNVQKTLDELWVKHKTPLNCITFTAENAVQASSSVLSQPSIFSIFESMEVLDQNKYQVEGGADREINDTVIAVHEFEFDVEHECEVNDIEGVAKCDVEGGAEHDVKGGAERDVEFEVNSIIPASHEFEFDVENEIEVVDEELYNNSSSFTHNHNNKPSTIIKDNFKKKSTSARGNHRMRYLPGWEKKDQAQYVTYVFDNFGEKHEQSSIFHFLILY